MVIVQLLLSTAINRVQQQRQATLVSTRVEENIASVSNDDIGTVKRAIHDSKHERGVAIAGTKVGIEGIEAEKLYEVGVLVLDC